MIVARAAESMSKRCPASLLRTIPTKCKLRNTQHFPVYDGNESSSPMMDARNGHVTVDSVHCLGDCCGTSIHLWRVFKVC